MERDQKTITIILALQDDGKRWREITGLEKTMLWRNNL